MKFMLLAFNPKHVRLEDVESLINGFKEDFPELKIHLIAHLQETAEPIYCVQFADTKMDN